MQVLFVKYSDSRLLFIKNHALDEVFLIDVELHGAMINFIIGAIESLHSIEKFLSQCYKVSVESKFALIVSLSLLIFCLFTLYIEFPYYLEYSTYDTQWTNANCATSMCLNSIYLLVY